MSGNKDDEYRLTLADACRLTSHDEQSFFNAFTGSFDHLKPQMRWSQAQVDEINTFCATEEACRRAGCSVDELKEIWDDLPCPISSIGPGVDVCHWSPEEIDANFFWSPEDIDGIRDGVEEYRRNHSPGLS